MVKVASNEGAAQSAVAGIKNVSVKNSATCSIGKSNISSMKTGASVCNQLLSDISKLVKCVNNQADKFPQLAATIAARDNQTKF